MTAAVLLAAVIAAVLLVVDRSKARPEPDPVAVSVPTALAVPNVPAGSTIGMIVTLGSGAPEGTQWSGAANGAVVALQRLRRGGVEAELEIRADWGTDAGAAEAVAELAAAGVSGIVYASSGGQLAAGLRAAQEASIPVILPYAPVPDDVSNAWSLSTDEAAVSRYLQDATAGFERLLFVDCGDGEPVELRAAETASYDGGNLAEFSNRVAGRAAGLAPLPAADAIHERPRDGEEADVLEPADAVVLSGSAMRQATFVYALQTQNVSVPVFLTPQATSPVFGEVLASVGGTVTPNLRTIGASWSDADALRPSGQGRAMSAYLAAVRQLAGDPTSMSLAEDAPFLDVATFADVRSHDAVLSLAHAIGGAGSRHAEDVLEAVSSLDLSAGDGIAGPSLDFSDSGALADSVTVLEATGQNLGLRPRGQTGSDLVWMHRPGAP